MTLTRRRLLRSTVGIAGVTACGRAPLPPELRWVGPSPARGHVLREHTTRSTSPAERLEARIVVVGAGVAGAAALWRLSRAGVRDVLAVDLESVTGGTAASGVMRRSAYPMGAHYLPAPAPSFTGLHVLLEDLDLIIGHDERGRPEYDPRWICRAPLERHRYRGIWYEGRYPSAGQTPEEEAQWERWWRHLAHLDGRRGSDGRALFAFPVQASSTELRHLDRISMADYLDRLGFDSWRLRWTVDYACRDEYGCTLRETSAFAGLHHYLSRGLGGAGPGDVDHVRFLLTWPEGNARLVDEMLVRADLGDRLRLDTAVTFIDPDEGRIVARDFAAEADLELRADVILWAAPRFVLTHVLPSGRDPLRKGAMTYAPWLVANVEVSEAPRGIGAPLSWENVGVGSDDLGYVLANHGESLVDANAPGAVLTYYRPLCEGSDPDQRRTELLTMKLETAARSVTDALRKLHPGIESTIRRIDIARWGHGMVRTTPGWLFGEDLRIAGMPIGRVVPCASDVGGLPLFEEAFCRGVAGAEIALSRLGVTSPSLL